MYVRIRYVRVCVGVYVKCVAGARGVRGARCAWGEVFGAGGPWGERGRSSAGRFEVYRNPATFSINKFPLGSPCVLPAGVAT